MKTKKIDVLLKEELAKLEKEFSKEYGQDPVYQQLFAGEFIYSVKITNSKIPISSYRSSIDSAKLAALQKALKDMEDE